MASESVPASATPPSQEAQSEPMVAQPKGGQEVGAPRPSGRIRQRKRKRNAEGPVPHENLVRLTPWIESLGTTEYESKEQRLHDEIVAYTTYILPTPEEDAARTHVVDRVTEVIQRRFTRASVSTFGSVAQALYTPDGDIDLVMTMPQAINDEDKKRILFQLAAALKNAHVTTTTQVVHHARVPVVHFQTTPELGSYKIDVSLNHEDGVKAVPVISDYLQRMPALRYLVMVMKGFLSQHGLNSAAYGGLSSYSVICLVISFLQLNPLNRPDEFISKPLESESLGTLLMDFLDYYGNIFPYETSYISVLEGKLLPKEAKGWARESMPFSLSIECLINPENDVGKSTSQLKRILDVFNTALTTLRTYSFGQAQNNVLGSILGIPEETIAQREHVQELIHSGSLEKALTGIQLPPVWRRQAGQTQARDPPPHLARAGAAPSSAASRPRPSDSLPARPTWDSYRPSPREDDHRRPSRYDSRRESTSDDRRRTSRRDDYHRDSRRDDHRDDSRRHDTHRDSRRDDTHRDSRSDDTHRDSRREGRGRDTRSDDRYRESRRDGRSRNSSSEEPRRKRHRD